jgi:phosphohistidine phosphatase
VKTLLLLRHGKSDWTSNVADHDRVLAPRGEDAAGRIGRFLAELGQVPERVVSSTAIRARDTAERAAEAGEWEPAIETRSEFYGIGPDQLLEWVQGVEEPTGSLLLVGHQPTWSMFAEGLIGGGNLRFPTAALARIDLHVERWHDVDFGCGELIWYQIPRVLKRIGWPSKR